jgi:hypothetical protein
MQLELFDPKIIPSICAARDRYLSAYGELPDLLHLNSRQISLLKAFFKVEDPDADLWFWGCKVIKTKSFHPYFSHTKRRSAGTVHRK